MHIHRKAIVACEIYSVNVYCRIPNGKQKYLLVIGKFAACHSKICVINADNGGSGIRSMIGRLPGILCTVAYKACVLDHKGTVICINSISTEVGCVILCNAITLYCAILQRYRRICDVNSRAIHLIGVFAFNGIIFNGNTRKNSSAILNVNTATV